MSATSAPVRALLLAVALATALPLAAEAQDADSRSIGPSGLPLPRFASLAAPEVNVRTGPSTDYPIRWVYARVGLPVKIVEEFDVWRRIEDPDGETGWAHSSLLSIRKTVMLTGTGIHELRRSPVPDARVVLRAESGVMGELDRCEAGWCRVEIEGTSGWMPAEALWGAL